ncbi:MAG: GNAT family N-acetyltransferase [Alphaproteobacteria bacterium]
MLAPIVETERLILRGYTPADFPEAVETWADPEVVRYVSGRASTPEETWARLLRNAGLWSLLGYGYWAVEEKSSGRFIGDVGFGDFKRTMTPLLDGAPEIGWVLSRHAQGKGYATEAARAALDWGERQWGQKHTVCIIDPDNTPSLRVADKLGYAAIARSTYKDHDVIVLRRG